MTEFDLHWLAGILEGEGSFCKPTPSAPNRPIISIQMTDEDVIARIAKIFEVAYHKSGDKRNPDWKPCYIVKLRGKKAVELMLKLKPLMGVRRQKQIETAIATYNPLGRRKKLLDNAIIEIKNKRHLLAEDVAKEYDISKWTVYKIWQDVMHKEINGDVV